MNLQISIKTALKQKVDCEVVSAIEACVAALEKRVEQRYEFWKYYGWADGETFFFYLNKTCDRSLMLVACRGMYRPPEKPHLQLIDDNKVDSLVSFAKKTINHVIERGSVVAVYQLKNMC